jgi:hypothetical protein
MEKTIEVNGKPVIIKKIPLGKYPEIINVLKGFSEHKKLLGDYSNTAIIAALPDLIMVAMPTVYSLVCVVTGVQETDVKEWGLDDFVRVIEIVFELNNYEYIYTTLKKAAARLKQEPQKEILNGTPSGSVS